MGLREKMIGITREEAMEKLINMSIPNQLLKVVTKFDDNEFNDFLKRISDALPKDIVQVFLKKIPKLPDLINSEGGIFEIVEGNIIVKAEDKFKESTAIFLKGWANKHRTRVFAKVNIQSLSFYFQGRITLKELFLLRIDEPFILEIRSGKNVSPGKYTRDFVFYDEYLDRSVLSTLQCGNEYYFQLPKGMRVENPTTEVLDILYSGFLKNDI